MCRRVETAALTPELALAYLRELQPDLADAAVSGSGGSGKLGITAAPGPKALATLVAFDAERVAEVLNS